MSTGWIVLGIVVLIIFYLIGLYNKLVALRQRCRQAFSDISVQLKLRYDLIPNLIETVKGYMKHEDGLLTKVTEARTKAMNASSPAAISEAEGVLTSALGKVMMVAEAYPDLKANTNFLKLQDELSDIENKISAARRFYNNAVGEFNTAIEQFPAVVFAGMFGFRMEEFFELSEEQSKAAAEPVKVQF